MYNEPLLLGLLYLINIVISYNEKQFDYFVFLHHYSLDRIDV